MACCRQPVVCLSLSYFCSQTVLTRHLYSFIVRLAMFYFLLAPRCICICSRNVVTVVLNTFALASRPVEGHTAPALVCRQTATPPRTCIAFRAPWQILWVIVMYSTLALSPPTIEGHSAPEPVCRQPATLPRTYIAFRAPWQFIFVFIINLALPRPVEGRDCHSLHKLNSPHVPRAAALVNLFHVLSFYHFCRHYMLETNSLH